MAKIEQRKMGTEANVVDLNGAANAAMKTDRRVQTRSLICSYRLPAVVRTTAGCIVSSERPRQL